jgi:hypothetical protein
MEAMGRLFSDATPEQEQAYIEETRTSAFLDACRTPLSWLLPARRHKRAADILYEIAHKSNDRELKRLFSSPIGSHVNGEGKTLEGQELIDYLNTELIGDYFLLVGYAIECVLKGYLLALRPELVKDEKQLDNLILTHNLIKLCKLCSIVLSEEEEFLLNNITRYLVWGKYPVPKNIDDFPSWVDDVDDNKKKSFIVGSVFHKRRVQSVVDGIFQRGLDLLNSVRNSQP